eukprot:gnl/TRDRNA2_/TRDRNA2_57849_c0_seq1.p1 gnl/TRDRNA2_/TRDRNA2_57849_c0~~gnl/TRDRNA2_/TRDRNA2_57849_c0_seq1.p1  ORF type:complete len:493 (+),score=62.23 gnl/TRDRNA2_/TRDRNA2_57849_c0_seq1:56-1480(+)
MACTITTVSPANEAAMPLLSNGSNKWSAPDASIRVLTLSKASSQEPLLETAKETCDDSCIEDGLDSLEEGSPSQFQAICNLTNIMVGVGMINMPFGMAAAGGVLGSLIMVSVVILMFFTGSLVGDALARTTKELELRGVPKECRDFAALADVAFGAVGKRIVAFIFVGEMWMVMETMIVLFGTNLNVLSGLSREFGITACTLLTFVLLLCSARFQSYISMFSLFAISFAASALLVNGLALPDGSDTPPFVDYHPWWRPEGAMTMVGLSLFSFAAHPALPSVYWTMKDPEKHFQLALAAAFSLAMLFYLSVAFIGFFFFGDFVDQAFTVNLGKDLHGHRLPNLSFLGLITSAGFVMKLQGTTPLILRPVATVLQELAGLQWKESPKCLLASGAVFATISWVVAVIFADQCAILAGLCGCLMTMSTSIVFPTWMYVRIRSKDLRRSQCALLLLVGMFGVFFALYGTYGAYKKMVNA